MVRRRKHSTRKHRRMRGGSKMFGNDYEAVTNSSGNSAWSYVSGRVGNLDSQYNGALMGNGSGNQLAINAHKGGRRRRSRRNRRGGTFLPVVANAIVPLGLLAAQQTYRRRKTRKSK